MPSTFIGADESIRTLIDQKVPKTPPSSQSVAIILLTKKLKAVQYKYCTLYEFIEPESPCYRHPHGLALACCNHPYRNGIGIAYVVVVVTPIEACTPYPAPSLPPNPLLPPTFPPPEY